MEECDQNTRGFFDQSRILMPRSDRYFVELSAIVLLNGAAKGYFRGKLTRKISMFKFSSKAKMGECNQRN